jgi:hypothetical protein
MEWWFIAAIAGGVAYALLALLFSALRKRDASHLAEQSSELRDFDADFLAAAAGKETREVARAFTRIEIDMMRSMLHSAGIPSLARYGTANLFGSSGGSGEHDDCSLEVFAEDFEEASRILASLSSSRDGGDGAPGGVG